MSEIVEFARQTNEAGGTVTHILNVGALDSAGGPWSQRGQVWYVSIRLTAGSATLYSWRLYSEDPAAPPGGVDAAEFFLAGALDLSGSGGTDDRIVPIADPALPDLENTFVPPIAWRPKTTAASFNRLWLVLVPDGGVDNVWTSVVGAGPRRQTGTGAVSGEVQPQTP